MQRRVAIAAIAVTASLTLGACSSSGSSQSAKTPVASTATTTSSSAPTSSAPSTPATSPVSSTSQSTALVACSISVLTLIDSGTNELHGTQAYGTIRARNTGTRTCTITGYPGVKVLQNHQPAPTKLSRAPGIQPRTVTLAPNAVASFGFSHTAGNRPGMCNQIMGFRVYDPDGSGYRITNSAYRDCGENVPLGVTVGPFEPGSGASIRP